MLFRSSAGVRAWRGQVLGLVLLHVLATVLALPAGAQTPIDSDGVYQIIVAREFRGDAARILRQQQNPQPQPAPPPPSADGTPPPPVPDTPIVRIGTGTGFLVQGRRIVATNNHVITADTPAPREGRVSATAVLVGIAILRKGEPMLIQARVIATDPQRDLALLEANADLPGTPFALGDYDPRLNLEVEAVGFPGIATAGTIESDLRSVSTGQGLMTRVSASQLTPVRTEGRTQRVLPLDTPIDGRPLRARGLLHTATIAGGNSGGPLINRCNQVIGINTFTRANLNRRPEISFFAVSSRELVAFMRENNITGNPKTGFCTFPGSPIDYVPFVLGILALFLASATAIFAWRRPAQAQRSYSEIKRSVLRAIAREQQGKGQGGGGTVVGGDGAAKKPPPGPGRPRGEATVVNGPVSVSNKPDGLEGFAARGGTTPLIDDVPGPLATVEAAPPPWIDGRLLLKPVGDAGSGVELAARSLFDGSSVVVGRGQTGAAALTHNSISRNHARLRLDLNGLLQVADLASGNGTWRGESRILTASFAHGDKIRFGDAVFEVSLPAGAITLPAARSWLLSGKSRVGDILNVRLSPGGTGFDAETIWTIGRDDQACEIVIADASVTQTHAQIRYRPGVGLEIADLGSTNGTKLNGTRLTRAFVALPPSARVKFGSFEATVTTA